MDVWYLILWFVVALLNLLILCGALWFFMVSGFIVVCYIICVILLRFGAKFIVPVLYFIVEPFGGLPLCDSFCFDVPSFWWSFAVP